MAGCAVPKGCAAGAAVAVAAGAEAPNSEGAAAVAPNVVAPKAGAGVVPKAGAVVAAPKAEVAGAAPNRPVVAGLAAAPPKLKPAGMDDAVPNAGVAGGAAAAPAAEKPNGLAGAAGAAWPNWRQPKPARAEWHGGATTAAAHCMLRGSVGAGRTHPTHKVRRPVQAWPLLVRKQIIVRSGPHCTWNGDAIPPLGQLAAGAGVFDLRGTRAPGVGGPGASTPQGRGIPAGDQITEATRVPLGEGSGGLGSSCPVTAAPKVPATQQCLRCVRVWWPGANR